MSLSGLFPVRPKWSKLLMYQTSCEFCGKRIEAQKPTRKWCSDQCRKRAGRSQPPTPSVQVMPAVQADTMADSPDPYASVNLSFARYMVPDLRMDLDVMIELVDPVSANDSQERTHGGWDCVARELAARLIAALERYRGVDGVDAWPDVRTAMSMLNTLNDDLIADRLIDALAAALGE